MATVLLWFRVIECFARAWTRSTTLVWPRRIQITMKPLVILGALVGFLIGGGFGLAGQATWPTVLWRACAGALVAGVLTRWWKGVWIEGLRDAVEQRRHSRRPGPNGLSTKTKP